MMKRCDVPSSAWNDRPGWHRAAGSDLVLAALPSAPGWARRHVRAALRGWDVDSTTVETAELLVSELVTNAATCSVWSLTQPARDRRAVVRCIWLTLRMLPRRLTIEVSDLDPDPPVLIDAGPGAESGRGLMLVDALSTAWGYFCPPSGGKTVFCVIELPPIRAPHRWALRYHGEGLA